MSAIVPLPKSFMDQAKKLNINKISLEFEGGGDEGQWYVDFERHNPEEDDSQDNEVDELEREIEDWAYEAYPYSGDGDDHGFDIMYDLEKMKATSEYWRMGRQYDDPQEQDINTEQEQ